MVELQRKKFLFSVVVFYQNCIGMSLDLESLSEATSGAVGALVSSTVLYPLDTCKAKYQAELRAHGQRKYRLVFGISRSKSFFVFPSFCF